MKTLSQLGNIPWDKIVNPPPDPERDKYRALIDFIFYSAEPDEDDPLT